MIIAKKRLQIQNRRPYDPEWQALHLSNPEDIPTYVEKGYSIFEIDEENNETLIASPEIGILKSIPVNTKKFTYPGDKEKELEEALTIIINGE